MGTIAILVSMVLIFLFYLTSKKNKFSKALLTIVVFGVYFVYILLRIFSIPFKYGITSTVLGLLLLFAEILGFFAFMIYIYIFYTPKEVKIKNLKGFKNNLPTVDVLICTYNEPIDLLMLTIVGAMDLDYPKELLQVYVLDDGHREELKKLTEKLGVNYISREKNEFAKAGNINNALKYTKGELFLVLDADMIPKKEYLQRTVGQFTDPNLAFVQLPQTYYNEDVYQYNTKDTYYNEQDFFMRCIEPARNSRDAVLHIGTNAIFRKEYVMEVGGYPTSSITEDMALGLMLQAKGYSSTFINEPLVVGLSALNLADLVRQRDRWCRGNLQVLRNFKKVIREKLNLKKKLIYIDGVLYWYTGVTKMIYLIMPIIHILTGIPIVNYDKLYLIPLFFEAFVGQILLSKRVLQREIPKNYMNFFYTGNIYNTVMAPHLTYSVLKHYFFSDVKFSVTSKKMASKKGSFSFKYVWCSTLLLFLSLASVFIGAYNVFAVNFPLQSYLINSFWLLYNLPGLFTAIQIGYQKPRPRHSDRIDVREDVGIRIIVDSKEYICKLKNISIKGVLLEKSPEIQIPIQKVSDIKLVLGKTLVDATLVEQRGKNLIALKFLDDNSLKEKIMIIRVILKFIKPYKDNYNLLDESN